jgi:hypothetical protein
MPVIQCTDAGGAQWEIFEVTRVTEKRDAVRPQLSEGWLCFQRADGHKVRVARGEYPQQWQQLPPDRLLELIPRGLTAQGSVLPRLKRD